MVAGRHACYAVRVIVHLNGNLLDASEARISPFDRGFVFGDGVYEGLRAIPTRQGGRRIIGSSRHVARFRAGLELAEIRWDPSHLEQLSVDLVSANGLTDAFVYWQVTRGTPGPGQPVRSRAPSRMMTPTVFGYCTPQPSLDSFASPPTKTVITCDDRRWSMGHMKSISLMGNIVPALAADHAGADEAIFIQRGLVAEGLATNVLLALPPEPGGSAPDAPRLVTPSLESVSILSGVTRSLLLRAHPEIQERAVDSRELDGALEVMLIGTTTFVTSVTRVNDRVINGGVPGPVAHALLRSLLALIREGRDAE